MSSNMIEVRAFLAGMAGHAVAPKQIPQALRVVVRGAAGARCDPDDLLQDVVADLLVRTRKHQTGGIPELLKMEDGQLLAALGRRVFQASAAAGGDRWKTVKLIRERVRAVLRHPLPVVDAPPTAITRVGRVDTAKVAEAVAWHRAQPENAADGTKEIAAWVVAEYFPEPHASDLFPAAVELEDDLESALDGPRIVEAVRTLLATTPLAVVAHRASGAPLKAIAEEQGCAVSTIHEQVRAATGILRDLARRLHWSAPSLRLALIALDS